MRLGRQVRRLREKVRRGGTFYLYLFITVAVVAYVAVPWVVELIDSMAGYAPKDYEPKDAQRADYLTRIESRGEWSIRWPTILKLAAIAMVVLLWVTILPPSLRGGPR